MTELIAEIGNIVEADTRRLVDIFKDPRGHWATSVSR